MKTEKALALIDKTKPTKDGCEKLRAKLISAYGDLMEWPSAVDKAFEDFETCVLICSR